MITSRHTYVLFALSILVLLLFSCKSDQEANYRYQIENKTGNPVKVVVEVKQNPGVDVYGDPKRYYTIAQGESAQVWVTSGFATNEVYDEEMSNKEIYWISVTAASNGRSARGNLNSTSRWTYKKNSSHSATYTLTLRQDDFLYPFRHSGKHRKKADKGKLSAFFLPMQREEPSGGQGISVGVATPYRLEV
ncbi:hypothetical protein [Pontibacter mangrovi]|uniref:Uncharacterized protein n=1 Tax=Pontibacter mangrovi TaxID=2589816 RepID=A0A501W6F7_9BACT|nr:hypothetical protein [Pontibacter mangrovi]TPE43684.1 hypothetical protein FJM65_13120 [Pontibacter mangrovi]